MCGVAEGEELSLSPSLTSLSGESSPVTLSKLVLCQTLSKPGRAAGSAAL